MTAGNFRPDPSPLLDPSDDEDFPTGTASREFANDHVIQPQWAASSDEGEGDRDRGPPRHHSTPARWYVLLSYCLLASFQNLTFNAYSPIYPVVSRAFPSWTPSFLESSLNAANVAYVLCMYPASLAYTSWDVRRITLVSGMTVLAGAVLRCFPVGDGPAQQGLTVASMILNGVGACWMGFGGPVIAERWFPPEERTLATSLGAIVAPFAGTAMGFVVGPILAGGDVLDEGTARVRVDRLFLIEAGLCLLALLCCAAYFPDRPEQSPSKAAAAASAEWKLKVRREETSPLSTSNSEGSGEETEVSGMLEDGGDELRLLSDGVMEGGVPTGVSAYFGIFHSSLDTRPPAGAIAKYWAMCLGLALPLGISQGWSSVLYSILSPLGATEGQAATLGFTMTSAGCVGAIAVGAALGQCSGRLKGAATFSMGSATLSFILFSADASGYLCFLSRDAAAGLAFATSATAGAAFSASVPLVLELIVENSHGWADGGAGVMISSLLSAVVQIVFTAALALWSSGDDGSTAWTSWVAAGSAALGFVALLAVRVEYRRLAVDQGTALSHTGCRFDREFGCL
uniref:Major facilitator superfamily (MFS) profile domain-containing protein n=1 Tax=Odontella aurita TaxID=265563 RepID=A0A7S4JBU7_9STRA